MSIVKNNKMLIKNIDEEIKANDRLITVCCCLLSVLVAFAIVLMLNNNGLYLVG